MKEGGELQHQQFFGEPKIPMRNRANGETSMLQSV